MGRWIPLLALALPTLLPSGCGITSRHTLGPTVDSQGYFGLRFAGALGPLVTPRRALAVPLRLGAAITNVERRPQVDGEAALAFEAGVGVDWVRGHAELAPAPGAPRSDRLGTRIGGRTGWLRLGDRDAWTLGVVGAVTFPLRGNLFALGLEGGCDALLAAQGADPPRLRCDLGVVFDLTRTRVIEPAQPRQAALRR